MKAIILAGGFGKRLHPLTAFTPKPLLPIVGKPVMAYILDSLYAAGVRDIIVSVNKTHEPKLRKFLGDGAAFGMRAEYFIEDSTSDESKPGAVGALEKISYVLDNKGDYIVAGADNFAPDFDFGKLAESHRKSKAIVTLALNSIDDKDELRHLGVAVVDSGSRVIGFQEKPKPEEAISNLANTAFFVAKPEFFSNKTRRYVASERAAGRKPDNLGKIFEKMIEWGDHINAYTFEGLWIDVGNPKAYLRATRHSMKSICNGNGAVIDWSAKFDTNAAVLGTSIIEKNVEVGRGSIVREGSHIMENVRIGKGCIIEGAVIFPNADIGDNARLQNCIVATDAVVPEGHISEEHTIIYNDSTARQPSSLP